MSERGRAHKRDRENSDEETAKIRRRPTDESNREQLQNNSVSRELNQNVRERVGFGGSSNSRGILPEPTFKSSNSFEQRPRGHSYSNRGNSRSETIENNREREINNRGSYYNNRGGFNNRDNSSNQHNDYRRSGQSVMPGPIQLMTNFFEVKCTDTQVDWNLYQYHVNFEPDIQSKALKSGLLKEHYEMFKNSRAFDGSTIYSMTKLPDAKTVVKSQRQRDSTSITITISLVKEIFPGDIQTITMFNSIFKRCLKRCKFVEFGKERAYFDFENMQKLGSNINIILGYKATIDLYGSRLLLCTELASKLINQDTVLDVMKSIRHDSSRDIERYKSAVNSKLIGQTVVTNYNKRTYKIDDIDWDSKASGSFRLKNQQEISFYEYYQKYNGLKIKDLGQPLLISRPNQKDINRGEPHSIMLIPEFCALTGQSLIDVRNFNMKKQIDQITKLNPQMRQEKLTRFLQQLKEKEETQEDLKKWQMKLSDDLLKINAKVLQPVKIFFNDNVAYENTTNGWDDKIKNSIQLRVIPLKDWIIMFMPRNKGKAILLKRLLFEVSGSMGLKISEPRMISLADSQSQNVACLFVEQIKESLNGREKPQFILCIVPSNDKTTYSAIKRKCCIDFAVPSQIITERILDENKIGKTKSVVTKVGIQINCKLGGEAWGVFVNTKSIMIIGIDMYKDSSNRNLSVLAFVASLNGDDQNCSRYYSRVVMQERKASYSDRLQSLMKDSLEQYLKVNGYLPAKVLIYRDGVGDSQLRDVKEHEIDKQIRKSFDSFPDYKPKLTFVVVQKRGNVRFFYKEPNNNCYQNAPMGTVVDNTITGRKINNIQDIEFSDFYLISQNTRQGTVSPSHFRVLVNEFFPERPECLQILTYKLTHMYYNWPGQIKVPAPCQYAQKLAHLVGESLHGEHHIGLNKLLYYL